MRLTLAAALLACLPVLAPNAIAATTSPDSSAAPQYFSSSPLAVWHLEAFGDVRIRRERTHDIPGRKVPVDRARGTLRSGVAWTPDPRLSLEVAGRTASGNRQDVEFPRVDNEAADTLQLDLAGVWLQPWAGATARAGKMAMPLKLSELLWDPDLRPVGLSVSQRRAVGALDLLHTGAGVWHRDRFGRDAVVGVAQAGYARQAGAPHSFQAVASWLWFEDTERLARTELGRQNRVLGTGDARVYAVRYRLVDLQLEGRYSVAGVPLSAGVDLVRNVEGGSEGDGVRTRLAVGGFGERMGVEAGWSYMRTEREALLGAFASDEWWSRTRMHGHMAWLSLGWSDQLRLRVFETWEWRDGSPGQAGRVAGELTARWGGR